MREPEFPAARAIFGSRGLPLRLAGMKIRSSAPIRVEDTATGECCDLSSKSTAGFNGVGHDRHQGRCTVLQHAAQETAAMTGGSWQARPQKPHKSGL
jgi:hypothetical protein